MRKYNMLILMMLILCFLTGCYRTTKYENGFIRDGHEVQPLFYTGVKTDKILYEIDDVTLKFYFGFVCEEDSLLMVSNPNKVDFDYNKNRKFVSISAYFYNSGMFVDTEQGYDDYKNIAGTFWIKDYEWEYLVEPSKHAVFKSYYHDSKRKVSYGYSEEFTIPSESFDYTINGKGKIGFGLAYVFQDIETGKYYFDYVYGLRTSGDTIIEYEFVSEKQIKFIK